MAVCIYRYIHTTTLYYWPNTTGMPHLKILHTINRRKANWTGRKKWQEDEEEDVINNWKTSRKREATKN